MKRTLILLLTIPLLLVPLIIQLSYADELPQREITEPKAPATLPMLVDKNEAQQHKQLSLSLRNQRLLEQQAESRAKQLLFQLQAAEAWAAIQRLGGELTNTGVASAAVVTANNDAGQVPERVFQYRVHALVKRENVWVARVNNGYQMITLRDGDTITPGIIAKVNRGAVELIADNWRYKLSME
ncbi:MAG: hypothetical protein LAT53_03640 [Idiomarina sp.]|nr:hypothetical protein [Idiomarina sp.]